ncbi:hypothetical protein B566_EDAN001490 [Ephemera danica]|nr:hypothetical protein B566_EDAN001490 [Ephemera danica]
MEHEDILDSQNRLMTENLSLKLAFDIESEAKEHHGLLDGLGSDFESSNGMLSGGMNRIHRVLNGGRNNRRAMFYMASIVTGTFLVIYFTFSVFQNSKS